MKKLLLLWVSLCLAACQSERQEAKETVKEVSEVVTTEGKPLQNEDGQALIVTGRITSNLSMFGKGAYRLADKKRHSIALTVLTKDGITRTKGDTVTVRISRSEVLRINGASWSVYNEL